MRNKTLHRFSAVALLALAATGLGGCLAAAVVAAGAVTYGAIKYTENEAYQDFSANLETTWRATLVSMADQGYVVNADAPVAPTGGEIESGDAQVHVTLQPGDKTRVTVRIGTFETDEHRRRAQLLLERIEKELK